MRGTIATVDSTDRLSARLHIYICTYVWPARRRNRSNGAVPGAALEFAQTGATCRSRRRPDMGRGVGRTLFVVVLLPDLAAAHGLLTCPSPRQNRASPIPGNEWTNWMGAAGDGYAPGYGNSQNLNGGGRNL